MVLLKNSQNAQCVEYWRTHPGNKSAIRDKTTTDQPLFPGCSQNFHVFDGGRAENSQSGKMLGEPCKRSRLFSKAAFSAITEGTRRSKWHPPGRTRSDIGSRVRGTRFNVNGATDALSGGSYYVLYRRKATLSAYPEPRFRCQSLLFPGNRGRILSAVNCSRFEPPTIFSRVS